MTLFFLIFLLTIFTFLVSSQFPFLAIRPKLIWAITLIFPFKACLALLFWKNENAVTQFLQSPIQFSDAIQYHHAAGLGHEFGIGVINIIYSDPGFAWVLYLIVGAFRKFGVFNVTHEHLLMCHAFISHMMLPLFLQVLYSIFKNPRIAIFGFILAAIDFNFIVYSSILLREMETALLYVLIGWAFLKNRWIPLALLLFPLFYLRKDAPILIIICVLIWGCCRPIVNRYPLLSFITIIVGVMATLHVGPLLFPPLEIMLFSHITGTVGSGFGSIILNFPAGLRLLGYSALGAIGTIPTYPFFSEYKGILLPFIGLGLSNITYFTYHIILFQGLIITRTLTISPYRNPFLKLYFLIVIHHLLFIGLVFNSRHRIQFLPLMIIGGLYVWLMAKEKGFTLKTFFGSRAFILAVFITLFFNILYLVIKLTPTLV